MMGFSFGRFAMAAAALGVLAVPVSTAAAAERDPLKPVWLNTLKADNGFDIILAPGGKDVWAFGTAHPDYKDRPLIYRKKDVWMVGYHSSDWKNENSKESSFLLRYKNGKWRKEKTDPAVPIDFEPVPDGSGGLWFLASEDTSEPDGVSEDDLFLTHRTASGRWSERFLGHVVRGTPGVADMVRLPGTQRLLGAGHIEPPTGNYYAAIFQLP